MRLGVIGAQLQDHHVRAEVRSLLEGSQLPVRSVAVLEQRGAVHAVIADGVAFAEQIAQHLGITVIGPVANGRTIGNAVAHTGNARHGIRPAGEHGDGEENAKNDVFHGKKRALIKPRLPRACKLFGAVIKHSHAV